VRQHDEHADAEAAGDEQRLSRLLRMEQRVVVRRRADEHEPAKAQRGGDQHEPAVDLAQHVEPAARELQRPPAHRPPSCR